MLLLMRQALTSLILRIEVDADTSQWLTVQHLRTGEMLQFASYQDLISYLQTHVRADPALTPEQPAEHEKQV